MLKFALPETPSQGRISFMQPDRTDKLTRLLRERILILDGAWGTMIQERKLAGPGDRLAA